MIRKLIQLSKCKTVSRALDGADIVEITLTKPIKKIISSLDHTFYLKDVKSIWVCIPRDKNINHFIDIGEDMKIYLDTSYFLDVSKPRVNIVNGQPVIVKHPRVWVVERPFVDQAQHFKRIADEARIRRGNNSIE